MRYLDIHSGSLQAVASFVLVVITGVYTVLTRAMAKAAQEALRPYVYLDVSFTSPAEMIVLVGNSGTKVASNVRATVLTASNDALAALIRKLPLATGIGHLAPGSTRKYSVIVNGLNLFPGDGPAAALEFKFTYHDGRRTISDRQQIDLAGYRESLFPWYGDNTHEIVRQLQNIADKLPEKRIVFHSTRKACPYCSTLVPESAKKCHACHEWISGASKRSSKFRTHDRARRP